VKGSEPVLVVAEIGPVSAQFAPVIEPDDELPEPADEPLPVQHEDDEEDEDELPLPVEPLPDPLVQGFLDCDTLWTPDCP
jgi:hypothetical protein